MPQLVTFSGLPVKRRKRVADGLLLTFFATERGQAGEQLVVSDDQWRRLGRVEFYRSGTLPDVRFLAARSQSPGETYDLRTP